MEFPDFKSINETLRSATSAMQVVAIVEEQEKAKRFAQAVAEENARKDAVLVEGAQANIAQKTLLEEQLKAVKEQNEQLKENYRLLNELYENSKVDAQKSAKDALHNKIFGWVSFGVGTFIGIAGILFGVFFS